MADNCTPGAAEIEAAVDRAQRVQRCIPIGWTLLEDARALLHLHATVTSLTARAEAAEADVDKLLKRIDGMSAKHQDTLIRAEALAARGATWEADGRERWDLIAVLHDAIQQVRDGDFAARGSEVWHALEAAGRFLKANERHAALAPKPESDHD